MKLALSLRYTIKVEIPRIILTDFFYLVLTNHLINLLFISRGKLVILK